MNFEHVVIITNSKNKFINLFDLIEKSIIDKTVIPTRLVKKRKILSKIMSKIFSVFALT